MKSLTLTQNGLSVNLPVPAPVEQDGIWWEFTVPIRPKKEDAFLGINSRQIIFATQDFQTADLRWKAERIPRPTAEQLKAIGMRERDGKPVECKENDVVWGGNCIIRLYDAESNLIGRYRFVLEPVEKKESTSASFFKCEYCGVKTEHRLGAAGEWICMQCGRWSEPATPEPQPLMVCAGAGKCGDDCFVSNRPHPRGGGCHILCHGYACVPVTPEKHYSCAGCGFLSDDGKCNDSPVSCFGEEKFSETGIHYERRNWSPKPKAEPAPVEPVTNAFNEEIIRNQAKAWEAVWDLCKSLGMKIVPHRNGKDDVCIFIKEIAASKAQHPAVAALREAMRYCFSRRDRGEFAGYEVPSETWAEWMRIVGGKEP